MSDQATMSGGVPQALSHAISKIQGVSVNTFQITPVSGSQSVSAGGQIRIQLPTNTLCDMKTSKLHFSVTTAGTNTRLPNGVKSLFERVQIMAGGVSVYQGNNFFNIQEYAYSVVKNKPYNKDTEHGYVAVTADSQGGDLNATAREDYATGLGKGTVFSMDLGEMAEISPRVVDLSLIPQLEVIFYLAPNTVLSAPAGIVQHGTGDADFTDDNAELTNQAFTITNPVFLANCYSMADGMYSLAMAQRIQDLGFLELTFPQTLAFNQSWAGSARQSVGAMSINRVHVCWRPSAYATRGAPVLVAGSPATSVAGLPTYPYLGGCFVPGAGKSEFQSKYQRLQAPVADGGTNGKYFNTTNPLQIQLKMNSSNVPQFLPNQNQWMELTKWANNVDELAVDSAIEYLHNKFCISYPFNLPHNKWEKPCISGLDTRSANSYLEIIGTNSATTGYDCLVLVETSSILRVGAGKAIELLS